MERIKGLLKFKKWQGAFSLSNNFFVPMLGMILLGYVFYTGFFNLPQDLTNLTVFTSIFIGISFVFHLRSEKSTILFLALYLMIFFLPVTWLWRGIEFDNNVLMGIFPFNDAKDYLLDSYRLYFGMDSMIMYNGRPLLSGLIALLMWLFGGNVQIALAIICTCTALSVFYLALEIREIANPFSAGLMTAILFYLDRSNLGRVHTENLGLIFGALGLVLLMRGARNNNSTSLIFGAFSLSMALNARAGAFFVMPFLLLWAWSNRKTLRTKSLFVLIISVSLGFFVNMYLVKSFALYDKSAFSNFGHSLYGLAAGYKGWAYIYAAHPELTNTNDVLPYALDLILERPLLFVQGEILNYRDYFSPSGMFYLFNFQEQQVWIDWILYLTTVIGLCRLFLLRRTMYGSLILFLVIGIFISMSMIPHNDNGMRVLMATNPITALVAGLAFAPICGDSQKSFVNISDRWLEGYVLIMGLICFLGPFVVSDFAYTIPSLPDLDCPKGTEQISILVETGSYINVSKSGTVYSFLPNIRKIDIKDRLEDYYYQGDVPFDALTAFPGLERLVRDLDAGDTIMMGINLLELDQPKGPDEIIFLVTRTNRIEQFGGVNHFCATLYKDDRLNGNRFYHDESIEDFE